jgi:GDP-4-dehydro-6-deoxy-D-mannose reductase
MTICLITGGTGFVGKYLKDCLLKHGHTVKTMDLNDPINPVDITDRDMVLAEIRRIRPDRIYHLAGFSSVALSFKKPELCMKINVEGTKNLLKAISSCGLSPRTLIVSSADVYGKPQYSPIDEKHPTKPISPYGNSRIEQEAAALDWSSSYKLPLVICRSFAHTGPEQPDTFVIPSFRNQVKQADDGGVIKVGNLEVIRDFSDVKDVVRAYVELIERDVPDSIINVGSGYGFRLKDVLDSMIKESGKSLSIEVDPSRFRPADIMELVCDNKKLYSLIDFRFKKLF